MKSHILVCTYTHTRFFLAISQNYSILAEIDLVLIFECAITGR